MRQVPGKGPTAGQARYGFFGDGRLSRHWRHYFTSLGIPWSLWSRRLARADGAGSAAALLAGCEVLLLAVSDDAIPEVLAALDSAGLAGREFVHFSGGRSFPGAWGAHPLMSFGDVLYPPAFYRGIPVFVEQGEDSPDPVARFRALFPELPNPAFALPREDKAAYHALCSLAGGVTALVWQEFFTTLAARYGAPREALAGFPRRIVENVIEANRGALTGPVVRGDSGTIRAHREALSGSALEGMYEAFVAAAGSARP